MADTKGSRLPTAARHKALQQFSLQDGGQGTWRLARTSAWQQPLTCATWLLQDVAGRVKQEYRPSSPVQSPLQSESHDSNTEILQPSDYFAPDDEEKARAVPYCSLHCKLPRVCSAKLESLWALCACRGNTEAAR